ncbi:MAG: hypothetical protein AAFU78_22950, partial [Cyanobacteria bacterium J06633_2]
MCKEQAKARSDIDQRAIAVTLSSSDRRSVPYAFLPSFADFRLLRHSSISASQPVVSFLISSINFKVTSTSSISIFYSFSSLDAI